MTAGAGKPAVWPHGRRIYCGVKACGGRGSERTQNLLRRKVLRLLRQRTAATVLEGFWRPQVHGIYAPVRG